MTRKNIRYFLLVLILTEIFTNANPFSLESTYEAPCLANGHVMKKDQIWYVGNAKWQCVRDGYSLKSKVIGCRMGDKTELHVHQQKKLSDGKFHVCTENGNLVTTHGVTCQDSAGRQRQLGETWESYEKGARRRFTCQVSHNQTAPVPVSLGCIIKGVSSLFVPQGQTARHGKRYFYCGSESHVEIPMSFSYCSLNEQRIELLSTTDQNGVRYLCQYTEQSKTTLVPVACLYNKVAYHLTQIRVDAKEERYRCESLDQKNYTWVTVRDSVQNFPTTPKPVSTAKFSACEDLDGGCQKLASFCKVKLPKPSPCCTNTTTQALTSQRGALTGISLDDQITNAASEFEQKFAALLPSGGRKVCNCPGTACCGKCVKCSDHYSVQYFVTMIQILCPKTCGTCKAQG